MSLLEELKEKRQDAIENVAAEDLDIEATNLTLAEHQRVRAFWVAQINDLDKAIAALSPSEALLDPQPEAASPEFASDQDEALPSMDDIIDPDLTGGLQTEEHLDRLHAGTLPQIPEGFTPWSGGECPVPGQSVEYLCAADDVPVKTDRPEDWTWRHEGIPSRARIIAYRIIQPSAEAERIEDVSEPLATIEQTLITDDIPSIPREEIPIGAAVETYTDSGLETVKISGTTYVVDDEPERQAETQPEAAYAPVNEDEGLMWSNGFQTDAKSKAEPEQDKRPFWTRAPKPKVNA